MRCFSTCGVLTAASISRISVEQLREHVRNGTGLTIGVGMGLTKTLAKSAQWASKEWPQFGGVLALTPGNIRRTEKLLSLQ